MFRNMVISILLAPEPRRKVVTVRLWALETTQSVQRSENRSLSAVWGHVHGFDHPSDEDRSLTQSLGVNGAVANFVDNFLDTCEHRK
jgi:hypothetical protein